MLSKQTHAHCASARGLQVFVYYNLHRRVWSIRALEGENKGKVIAHATSLCLSFVKPKVSEAGRQRVLREQKKNVHAGLTGKLAWAKAFLPHDNACNRETITYNPYRAATFTYRDRDRIDGDGVEYTGSKWAWLSGREVSVDD